MLALVDDTVAELGSTDWREASGVSLQTCHLDGGTGVNYEYTRVGPPSFSPRSDVALVENFWNSKGYRTKVAKSSNPNDKALQLLAVGDAVKSIRYTADPEYTGFSVESVCIPGDFGTIIDSGDF
jgi:hypothetical protein